MDQPAFWLKVNKSYIFDNFENLIEYLSHYSYQPNYNNADFDETLLCMTDLCNDFLACLESQPIYEPFDCGRDPYDVLRLFGAVALADLKKGVPVNDALLGMIAVFSRSPQWNTSDYLDYFYDIALACIRRTRIDSVGFGWNDLKADAASPSLLASKLSAIKIKPSENGSSYYYEGKGLAVIPAQGTPSFIPMNFGNFKRAKLVEAFSVPGIFKVMQPEADYIKPRDFDHLYRTVQLVLTEQDRVRPTPRKALKDYDYREDIVVRITQVQGVKIVAETISPDYNKISGKVLIRTALLRPMMNTIASCLAPGAYLVVKRSKNPDFAFDIYDVFEEYYREYGSDFANEIVNAVPAGEYPKGHMWVSEDGVSLGMDSSKIEALSPDNLEEYERARMLGLPIRMHIYTNPPALDGPNFYIYAEADNHRESILADTMPFTKEDAQKVMVRSYLSYCEEQANDLLAKAGDTSYFNISARDIFVLACIISAFIRGGFRSATAQLSYTAILQMLCQLLERKGDIPFLNDRRHYIASLVMFAQNHEVKVQKSDASIMEIPSVQSQSKILASLVDYKRSLTDDQRKLTVIKEKEDSADPEEIDRLVKASNSLIGIIDDLEANKIKQIIARKLGVEDEFESILDTRTFYGMENISLEFKTSIVFPPANRRRYTSDTSNPDIQKWAIIKTVNGFLNSRNGGELLLGVNDAGYATGIASDMHELFKLNAIPVNSKDAYRTYIQNILDKAFQTSDSKVSSSDITRSRITYTFEDNADGYEILRIKIEPYRKELVKMRTPQQMRPDNIADAYVRRSGNTVAVTPDIAEEIRRYKEA